MSEPVSTRVMRRVCRGSNPGQLSQSRHFGIDGGQSRDPGIKPRIRLYSLFSDKLALCLCIQFKNRYFHVSTNPEIDVANPGMDGTIKWSGIPNPEI